MQTPAAPKVKAFLADIKANYLDEENAKDDAQRTYFGLLKMELLLRGDIVKDDSKVWQHVLSSAGKALATERMIPKPLLSGANVLAGRIAEVLFHNLHLFIPDLSASSSALQRAKDLKDQRFIVLLQQDFNPLEVAKGYFIRAAHANPDKPPMFKKVWDIAVAQYNDPAPFDAHYAIENLIRIADSKGNVKRCAELRLKLIQSYLNKETDGGDNRVANYFADCDDKTRAPDLHTLAARSKVCLNKCNANVLSNPDRILHTILNLRVDMALENATIDRLAQERYQADKNRSNPTPMSLIRSECEKQVLKRSEDPIQDSSFAVRDILLQLWSKTDQRGAADNIHTALCLEWVDTALLRLANRAQIVGENEAWVVVFGYLQELIDGLKTFCSWNLQTPRGTRIEMLVSLFRTRTTQETKLVSSIATIFPTAYWMLLSSGIEPMDEIFHLLLDLFAALQRCDQRLRDKDSNALGSKTPEHDKKLKWRNSRSVVMCFICQDNPQLIFQITKEGIARKRIEPKSPLGFLQCLAAWSGWFQSPWPHCSSISDARHLLAVAEVDSGRTLTAVEEVLLNLARADAELLQGGFAEEAGKLYLKTQLAVKDNDSFEDGAKSLLMAHCSNGLARATRNEIEVPDLPSIEKNAYEAMDSLQRDHKLSRLQMWHAHSILTAAVPYQLSVARQLIADSLVGQARCEEARAFLEAAVKDSPLDPAAAFSLGAFLLRIAFFVNKSRSEEADKKAQIQLLRAAKLNPSKAKPFGLLGFWFEEKGDLARAKGCYSKSLALDPCDPVAGRGMLRLESYDELKSLLDVAIDRNSSLNGWAWHAIGTHKVSIDGEDDFAIVAFLKAMRCRDIMQIENEPLGMFYHKKGRSINEQAEILEETGQCYRRLGRYTASVRAFYAAIGAYESEVQTPSSVLCSSAQVELELGLFEDAADKFARVLERDSDSPMQSIAAYGQGVALLSIAQRDLQDGKAGSAFDCIHKAIKACVELANDFSCICKLLGDLYSFGALVPLSLFEDYCDEEKGVVVPDSVEAKLNFVSRGEDVYRLGLRFHEASKPDDGYNMTRASILYDVACNVLLQADIASDRCDTLGMYSNVNKMYAQAAQKFEDAISCNPLHGAAWCGLGCAANDPLLSQHAFCRCLQIEKMLPDGYSNIGFLYTELGAYTASQETMNTLTQVADTPMMWINRALILERQAAGEVEKEFGTAASRKITEAADAYRAALQVMKHPDAIFGLALTCRVAVGEEAGSYRSTAHTQNRKNSSAFMKEFLAVSSHFQQEASMLSAVLAIEQAAVMNIDGCEWAAEVLEHGQTTVNGLLSHEDQPILLDTGSIDDCLYETDENTSTIRGVDSFKSLEDIQKQIFLEPNRPDLWLWLAKQIVGNDESSISPGAIESASRATERARSMLSRSLTGAQSADGHSPSFIKSEIVSDSFSLAYHLKSIQPGQESSPEIQRSYSDLQRSLLVCPDNPLALAALPQTTKGIHTNETCATR
eukprot:scaffold9159_cov121-Cylindrotheca_fusiformis.AAC.5